MKPQTEPQQPREVLFEFDASYLKTLPRLQKHADFLRGKREDVKKYLCRYLSERSTEIDPTTNEEIGNLLWSVRVENLHNRNLCRPIINAYLAFLSQNITRSEVFESDRWPELLDNFDGFGTPLPIFVRKLIRELLSFGRAAVIVEGPSETESNAPRAQDNNERSYADLILAKNICCFEFFPADGPRRGQLRSFACLEGTTSHNGATHQVVRQFEIVVLLSEDGSEAAVTRYASRKLLSKEPMNILAKVEGNSNGAIIMTDYAKPHTFLVVDEKIGELDYIPVQLFDDDIEETSVIFDTVDYNEEHLNKKSERDNINHNQAFKKIAIVGAKKGEGALWTQSNAAYFSDPNTKVIEIEPGDPQALTAELENIERAAVLSGLQRWALLHQLSSKESPSVESKRYDNITLEKFLNFIADNVERMMQSVVRIMWHFETGKMADPKNVYITILRDWDFALVESQLREMALMFGWAEQFNSDKDHAGDEIKAEIFAQMVSEMKMSTAQGQRIDDRKAELIKRIREIAKNGLLRVQSFGFGNISGTINKEDPKAKPITDIIKNNMQ